MTLTIDGGEITVPAGTLIIRAAEQMGIYVPRFCDHPLLDPLGACRQCLVEVEGQRKPLTSCTTTVADGLVVKTQATSEIARDGQDGVLEFLLINHPLDCPMCDKGGECPLQDQALAYGPGGSRYADPKRRFTKPIPISSLIKLDRERCVLCARCTRFSSEISGDPFIELFERSALEQVAISEDEPYQSVFSGNVVQICPVGALTATPYRFKARPFDVETVSSTCTRCASGCAIDVQSRRGELVRILARDDREVNAEWICDKGRWGYQYIHHPERVTEPLVRKEGDFVAVTWAEALSVVAERIGVARGPSAVLAGGNLIDEDAYALSRFARTVLQTNDVDAGAYPGADDGTDVLSAVVRMQTATNADLDAAQAIVVFGSDLHEESPILWLRARKAMRKRGARLFEVGPRRTRLSTDGGTWIPCAPGGETGILLALARALGDAGLDPWTRAALQGAGGEPASDAVAGLAETLRALRGSVVVLAGDRLAKTPGAQAVAWNLAVALDGRLGWVPRRGGARGAAWAGLHPGLLPGGRRVDDAAARAVVEEVWGTVPASPGRTASEILATASTLGLLYLVGVDPVGDLPGSNARALDQAPFVVAHDQFLTESSRRADVVLPASAPFERDGTVTNWEGRVRAIAPSVPPPGLADTDSRILSHVALAAGVAFPSPKQLETEMRRFKVEPADPTAIPVPEIRLIPAGLRSISWPRLLDAGTLMTGSGLLLGVVDPLVVEVHPDDAVGLRTGDAVRVSTASGELTAPVRVTDAVARGAVYLPARQGDVNVNTVISAGDPFPEVRLEQVQA